MNRTLLNNESLAEKAEKHEVTNPHSKNADGQTLLHIAANQGNLQLAKSLIEQHADVNAVTHFGILRFIMLQIIVMLRLPTC